LAIGWYDQKKSGSEKRKPMRMATRDRGAGEATPKRRGITYRTGPEPSVMTVEDFINPNARDGAPWTEIKMILRINVRRAR